MAAAPCQSISFKAAGVAQLSTAAGHRVVPPSRALGVVCRAEAPSQVDRRALLFASVAVGAASSTVSLPDPAFAAYGESANIFGSKGANPSRFLTFQGDNYALALPTKWYPSKQKDFAGIKLRWEDNFDPSTNLMVMEFPEGKRSIKDFGTPEEFLNTHAYILGESVYTGEAQEGGFQKNKVAQASLLDLKETKDKQGRPYYKYQILTRAADGMEGGVHHLIAASVGSNGKLYVAKAQAGDKRWIRGGTDKDVKGIIDSFVVS